MKLKTKILILSLFPTICLGIILLIVSASKVKYAIYEETFRGMKATLIAIEQFLSEGNEGEYRVDDNGDLWKGDTLNISQATMLVDQIKSETGMEVTIFYKDTRYLTSITDSQGKRQVGTQASPKVVERVLEQGKSYKASNVDVLGIEHVVCYVPIYSKNSETPVGMAFLGKKQKEVEEVVLHNSLQIFLIILIIEALAIVGVTTYANKLVKAMNKGIEAVDSLAGGDLQIDIEQKLLTRKDSVGDMCRSVNILKEKLLVIVGEIKNHSNHLYQASQNLTGTAQKADESIKQVDYAIQGIAESTYSQAEDTQSAGINVAEIGNMVNETYSEVEVLSGISNKMADASSLAQQTLNELNETMVSVKESIDLIYEQTNQTNESVNKISQAANLITDIASQTSLLSLNASIEAARAGEHGRGFSVVATEIQQLADQSSKSADEIQNILNQLTGNSNQAVNTMQMVKEVINEQEENISKTSEVFHVVDKGIKNSIVGINTISKKAETMESARINTVKTVESLAALSEENAATTQQTASSVQEVNGLIDYVAQNAVKLKDLSEQLLGSVNEFKLNK